MNLSGKFVIRMNPRLHKALRKAAIKEEKSLNTKCNELLSQPFSIPLKQKDSKNKALKKIFGKSYLGLILFGSVARGENLKNSDEELVSIFYDQIWGSVNVFTLNKNNGLAVWSKTRPDFLAYGSPYGSVTYLICR